jgi:putative peptide zinc metalloprotease protein
VAKRTFYDQWYRIGDLRIGLRRSVLVRKHTFRDEPWYVYYDPAHNGYFRARPETHEVIKRFTPDRTLREIWHDLVADTPKTAPGQEDFFDIVTALYRGNLLHVEGSVDEARLLDRAVTKKKKPLAQKVSQLLFFRIPLWDPEPFLERNRTAIDRFYSAPVVALVAAITLWAGYVFVLNADRAFAQSQGILQANNLVWLFLATFTSHFLHEISHAALCKHFGGHVRTMGVMLLIFTPLPYADVTASWSFRDPLKRAMVGAAGMYIDLLVCALATLFWAYSPPGMANEMALNLMFVTAAYTFVFNANPLMRFDGHYILSDLVAIPNLHQTAQRQFEAVARRLALGDPVPVRARVSPRRRAFLLVFFVAAWVYRTLVMFGIVIFVADQYYGLGLVGAAAIAYNAFVQPLIKVVKPLFNRSFMARHRTPVTRILLVVGAIAAGLFLVPVPDARRLEGVIEAVQRTTLVAGVEGEIVALPERSGLQIAAGQDILRLVNPDLTDQQAEIEAGFASNAARETQARANGGFALAAIEQERQELEHRRAENALDRARLMQVAPHAGIWVLGKRAFHPGNWVSKGEPVGTLVNQGELKFLGILPQESAYGIGTLTPERVAIRIEGQRDIEIAVSALSIVPRSQKDLPSAALSPLGGGGTSVAADDTSRLQSVERFFLFSATLAAPDVATLTASTAVFDGRTGWLRMDLPPRPLATQGWERLRQFFQQRYKL